ncbi:MAG: FlgO family outer membrane protein [Opitutaceae bacterium]|jgi:TolB-like protein
MKRSLPWVIGLIFTLNGYAAAGYEQEITTVSHSVSVAVTKAEKKKISVLDFTDLQGRPSELGRFLAEELSVTLVMEAKGFSVLDRANLKSILAEHKLTSEGLVNPENAKKLGQFAGVDAIVLGNITSLKDELVISIKIIATDTAEIVGAARAKILKTAEIQQLLETGITENNGAGSLSQLGGESEKKEFSIPNKIQKLSDFNVELVSFRVIKGNVIFSALGITNTNKQTPILVGANSEWDSQYGQLVRAKVVDDGGNVIQRAKVDGIYIFGNNGFAGIQQRISMSKWSNVDGYDWVSSMVKIKPGETSQFTMAFPADISGMKLGGKFKLQVELITALAGSDKPTPKLDNVYFENIIPLARVSIGN